MTVMYNMWAFGNHRLAHPSIHPSSAHVFVRHWRNGQLSNAVSLASGQWPVATQWFVPATTWRHQVLIDTSISSHSPVHQGGTQMGRALDRTCILWPYSFLKFEDLTFASSARSNTIFWIGTEALIAKSTKCSECPSHLSFSLCHVMSWRVQYTSHRPLM